MTAPPIAGYRELDSASVELVNQNKLIEELLLRQIEKVQSQQGIDQRFAAIAKTHIQEGFMALNRAIFQPQRLAGEIVIENDAIVVRDENGIERVRIGDLL